MLYPSEPPASGIGPGHLPKNNDARGVGFGLATPDECIGQRYVSSRAYLCGNGLDEYRYTI